MSEKPRATIDQAKAAWEAHPAPSIRSVVAALEEAGLACNVATLQRWRKAGWVLKGKTVSAADAKKLQDKAAKAVADGVKEHGDKVLTRIEVITQEEALMKVRAGELDKITEDSELARQAMRKSLIAQIVLSEQIIRRAALIAEVAPAAVPDIIEALRSPFASTTIVLPIQMPAQPAAGNGDGAKVVDGRVVREPSSSQLAIEAFKQRQRERVPA